MRTTAGLWSFEIKEAAMQTSSASTVVSQTMASLMSQLGRTKSASSSQPASPFVGSVASSAPAAGASGNALIGNAKPSMSDQVMGFLMAAQQASGASSALGKAPAYTTTTPISEATGVAA
jgi:hypothetical protein